MEKGFVHLRAISRMEKFERTMEAAGALEAAMDEAFDQDEEIVWPAPETQGQEAAVDAMGTTCITKDHEQYACRQNIAYLLSVPLRVSEEPVGVITCERDGIAFTRIEPRRRIIPQNVRRVLRDCFGLTFLVLLRLPCTRTRSLPLWTPTIKIFLKLNKKAMPSRKPGLKVIITKPCILCLLRSPTSTISLEVRHLVRQRSTWSLLAKFKANW